MDHHLPLGNLHCLLLPQRYLILFIDQVYEVLAVPHIDFPLVPLDQLCTPIIQIILLHIMRLHQPSPSRYFLTINFYSQGASVMAILAPLHISVPSWRRVPPWRKDQPFFPHQVPVQKGFKLFHIPPSQPVTLNLLFNFQEIYFR